MGPAQLLLALTAEDAQGAAALHSAHADLLSVTQFMAALLKITHFNLMLQILKVQNK